MAAWTEPPEDRASVDRAGEVIRQGTQGLARTQALEVIRTWRGAHALPLNAFQMTLRRRAGRLTSEAIIAQRLKRLPAIEAKLKKRGTMHMRQMQDVGGCRAVLGTLAQVEELSQMYLEPGGFRHRLIGEGKDYVLRPKADGYRSRHFAFSYEPTKDSNRAWLDLRIEVQIRTALQHSWAAAVETYDIFTGSSLKTGSVPDRSWHRFFKLMGSAMALKEGMPLVPGTPDNRSELAAEVRALEREHSIRFHLGAWQDLVEHSVIRTHSVSSRGHYLLGIDPDQNEVTIQAMADTAQLGSGTLFEYAKAEAHSTSRAHVVLVRVESLAALRLAYPSFFADTTRFDQEIRDVLTW